MSKDVRPTPTKEHMIILCFWWLLKQLWVVCVWRWSWCMDLLAVHCAVFYLNMNNNLQHVQKVVFWIFLSPTLPSCVVWIVINCNVLFWHENRCVLFFCIKYWTLFCAVPLLTQFLALRQGRKFLPNIACNKIVGTQGQPQSARQVPSPPLSPLPWSPFVYLSTLSHTLHLFPPLINLT